MYSKFTVFAAYASFLFGHAFAQSSSSVPSDLSSGFDINSITVSVSYNGNKFAGFKDGTKFTTKDTSSAPSFALGDSSGVNTGISFVIVMVDTTSKDRVLHFAQADFKADGDQTGISSSSQPAFAYKAPGSLGESGPRQYSFLLYEQNGGFKLPATGQTFDIKQFESSNGLSPALAGVSMNVDAGTGTPQQSTTQQASSTTDQSMSGTTMRDSTMPTAITDMSATTTMMTGGDMTASRSPMDTSSMMLATDASMPSTMAMSSDSPMATGSMMTPGMSVDQSSMTMATATMSSAAGGAASTGNGTSPSRAVSTTNAAVSRLGGSQVVMWTLLGLAVRYHY